MALKKAHVRKDDKVKIISGQNKGQIGKVLQVLPSEGRVIVDGINVVKRHTKPTQANPQGGILEKPAPIDISNVMLYCDNCKEATRIRMKTLDNGKLARQCKHCDQIFDK